MTKAIVHQPEETPAYYEREIRATFENGGAIEITTRGESIAGVIEMLLAIVAVIKLDGDRMTTLRISYWHLDEDLATVEVTGDASVGEFPEEVQASVMRRLAANAKSSLIRNLARHHIALRGERGEL